MVMVMVTLSRKRNTYSLQTLITHSSRDFYGNVTIKLQLCSKFKANSIL